MADGVRRPGRYRWQMALPLPYLLALRYLKSSRRDAYVSFLSFLAAGGITLGVAALILVLAGLSGLQHFLRSDVLARTPHVEVELPADADSAAVKELLAAVPGALEVRRLIRGRGWLLSGGLVADVEVVGYEGDLPDFFPGGTASAPGLYVGEGLAERWDLEPGDLVEVVSSLSTLTPLGPQPRLRRLPLAGTFRTGATEDQKPRAAVPLAVASQLFSDRRMRLELRAGDLDAALVLAERVAEGLPEGSRVRTWQDLNRGLFFALKLEKVLMFVSVFLMVPVAAMALVTVLALLISSKRAEVGMLQVLGAERRDVRRAFLALGTLLGGLGLAAGCFLGIAGSYLLDRYRLIAPPGDVYYLDHIPFRVETPDLLWVVFATGLLTTLSAVWAARKAASTRLDEALKD